MARQIFRENFHPHGLVPELVTALITHAERTGQLETLHTHAVQSDPSTHWVEPLNRVTRSSFEKLTELELSDIGPANRFHYQPGERLNIIAGDNSLGKSFLLDCLWWALTDEWIGGRSIIPVGNEDPIIRVTSKSEDEKFDVFIQYDWSHQDWKRVQPPYMLSGVVIYARYDGSAAIWDPANLYLKEQTTPPTNNIQLFLSRQDIWEGTINETASGRKQWVCNGLVRDWLTWQTGGERYARHFKALQECLKKLAPSPNEPFELGEPVRLPFDSREIPTLRMPYGDVPVIHASAGVQRIIGLAYLLVWAWQEHIANSKVIRQEPKRRMVLLIDEVEAHLHPFWQRTIVPALMQVVSGLAEEQLDIQLHVATHSPLVLASVEPVFDEEKDDIHHLKLVEGKVVLEELPFVKQGSADYWLMSEVFGLRHARSLPAEQAIERAKALQLEESPDPQQVQEVDTELVYYLAPDDPFWPRWRFFALQHGVQ